MAETVKAVEKPTKPEESAAKKSSEKLVAAQSPTDEEIAQLAYSFGSNMAMSRVALRKTGIGLNRCLSLLEIPLSSRSALV